MAGGPMGWSLYHSLNQSGDRYSGQWLRWKHIGRDAKKMTHKMYNKDKIVKNITFALRLLFYLPIQITISVSKIQNSMSNSMDCFNPSSDLIVNTWIRADQIRTANRKYLFCSDNELQQTIDICTNYT